MEYNCGYYVLPVPHDVGLHGNVVLKKLSLALPWFPIIKELLFCAVTTYVIMFSNFSCLVSHDVALLVLKNIILHFHIIHIEGVHILVFENIIQISKFKT